MTAGIIYMKRCPLHRMLLLRNKDELTDCLLVALRPKQFLQKHGSQFQFIQFSQQSDMIPVLSSVESVSGSSCTVMDFPQSLMLSGSSSSAGVYRTVDAEESPQDVQQAPIDPPPPHCEG